MMGYQQAEMKKVQEAINSPFATVFYVQHEWTAPDNPNLKRWKLIIQTGKDRLDWAHTYNPALAELGTHPVEFYKDSSYRLCIRKPKKG